jgi:hypothetical protein
MTVLPGSDAAAMLWVSVSDGDVKLFMTFSGGGSHKFLPRRLADIRAANDRMFDSLDDFSFAVGDWDRLDEQTRNEHLIPIASAGRALADALFGSELPTFVEMLMKHRSRRLELVVMDEGFNPYWDFLRLPHNGVEMYLGGLVTVTPGYFDNANAPKDMADEFEVAALGTDFGPVALAEDESLASACRGRHSTSRASVEEIYTLQPVVGDLSEIDVLRHLDPQSRGNEVAEINRWLGPMRRLVHFNCHGLSADRGRNADPNLQVTRSFSFGKTDIDAGDLSYALINLNVCNSAVGTYSSRRTLSQTFHDQNAAATICTTGSVDDGFATIFSRELYGRLAKDDLLTAMHETRKALLSRHNHPMSLMYTFTGPSAFRLDRL